MPPSMASGRWRKRAVLAALGAIAGLAQAPFGWVFLYFIALPLVFRRVVTSAGLVSAFGVGWWFGLGYFALVLNWIVQPFMVDVAVHGWMAPFAIALMSGGLALFWGLGFAVARISARSSGWLLVALATAWTLTEVARSTLFTGFPWGLVAYGWIGTPIDQALAILGPHGLGFVTILSIASLGLGFRPAIWGFSVVAFAAAWGIWRLEQPIAPRAEPVQIRVVQPNATQNQKWDPAWVPVFYERLLELTASPAAKTPDLVILPEMAIVYPLERYPEIATELSLAAGTTFVVGGHLWLEGAERVSNGLFVFDQEGEELARYAKHHLVPFGEYIPFGRYLQDLDIAALASGLAIGFEPGPGPDIIEAGSLPAFMPLICYEAIFPGEIRSRAGVSEWLLQITNDGWFGDWTGPYQHLAQAQARSIETGAPLVRSANTGVSAVIDARGRKVATLEMNSAGVLDVALPPRLGVTVYARIGDWPIIICLMLALAFIYARRNKGARRNQG